MRTKRLSKLDVDHIEFLASKIYPSREDVRSFVLFCEGNFNDLIMLNRTHAICPTSFIFRFYELINTLGREVRSVAGTSTSVFQEFVVFISKKMFS